VNIILLHPEDARGHDRYVVADRRAAHARTVLGLKVGAEVRVGLVDGPVGVAGVTGMTDDHVELECRWLRPAPPPWLDLTLAIPRPKQLRRILPQIAAIGLRQLTLLRTWRVQPPYLSSPLLEAPAQRPLWEEGLMQGGRTAWPAVHRFDRFEAYCSDRERRRIEGPRIVADPRAADDIADRTADAHGDAIEVVIGPEGGLLPYEVDRLRDCGFAPLRFGPSILRTDSACVAIPAQLDLIRRMALDH